MAPPLLLVCSAGTDDIENAEAEEKDPLSD
jgi:hypothetical protein